MKAINEPVKHTENYIQIKDWLKQQDGIVNISGNDGTDRVYLMHAFSSDAHVRLVVTYSEQRMEQLYEDFRFYDKAVYMYPSKDILFYSSDIHGNSITRRRMDIFRRLIEGEACTIILTVDALFDKMPDLSYIKKNVVTIREAEELDVEALKKRLVELGYEKADSVDGVGQFASNFKEQCGEYQTASSYALWMAAKALKEEASSRYALIYNQYQGINHSIILIKRCTS